MSHETIVPYAIIMVASEGTIVEVKIAGNCPQSEMPHIVSKTNIKLKRIYNPDGNNLYDEELK